MTMVSDQHASHPSYASLPVLHYANSLDVVHANDAASWPPSMLVTPAYLYSVYPALTHVIMPLYLIALCVIACAC